MRTRRQGPRPFTPPGDPPTLRPRGFYVVVRGPLGVGKTLVSTELARRLGATYISIDRILDEQDLWYAGRLREFLAANEHAAARAGPRLRRGTPVVIDGNFYWKTQILDLERRLKYPHRVFTLTAPVQLCVERDHQRFPPHGADAARVVYARSTRFRFGLEIDARGPAGRVVDRALAAITRELGGDARSRGRGRTAG